MQIIAHRGACTEAPENSPLALAKAVEYKVDGIECDVRCTKDGAFILWHDRLLYSSLKKLKIIDQVNIAHFNSWLPEGLEIAYLEQMLAKHLHQVGFHLEIKPPITPYATQLMNVLRSFQKQWDNLVISSFDIPTLKHLYYQEPGLNYALLCRSFLGSRTIGYLKLRHHITQLPFQAIHPSLNMLDERLMEYAQKAGLKVIPYLSLAEENQDRQNIWSWLYSLNVDGICTNYPQQLRTWLDEESYYGKYHQDPHRLGTAQP